MPIQEKIAVAAIVLAAAFSLVRRAASNHRKRRAENPCPDCGCGKALQITRRNGSGKSAATSDDR